MGIKDFIKTGIITAVYPERNTARVLFDDAGEGEIDSGELPFLVTGSTENKYYAPMPVDTQVLCLRLPHGKNSGYILGTWYNDVDAPPDSDGNLSKVQFADGTIVEHNSKSGETKVSATGAVTISASSITINGDTVNITGGSGDVVVNGISLVGHTHGGVQGGPSSTGAPQ